MSISHDLLVYFIKINRKQNKKEITDGQNAETGIVFQDDDQQYLSDHFSANACLDLGVDLTNDHVKDKDDAEVVAKELLDQVDGHERRSQPDIELSLEMNLGNRS